MLLKPLSQEGAIILPALCIVVALTTIIGISVGFKLRKTFSKRLILIGGYILGGIPIALVIVYILTSPSYVYPEGYFEIAKYLAIGCGIVFIAHKLSAVETPINREDVVKGITKWGSIAIAIILILIVANRLFKRYQFSRYQPLDMAWSYVPAGTFVMGSTISDLMADMDEFPQHEVYLDAFEINTYEVLRKEYVQCMLAGVCEGPGGRTTNFLLYSSEYPIDTVMFEHANSFCQWIGGRLPSEAEWEKAARGGLDQQLFPWGNEFPVCEEGAKNGAFFSGCQDIRDAIESAAHKDNKPRPFTDEEMHIYHFINSNRKDGFSPNGYGIYDMAGNNWEWTQDWYKENYYEESPTRNPLGPDDGERHVLRGGSSTNDYDILRVANRAYFTSGEIQVNLNHGFRCVRDPANNE